MTSTNYAAAEPMDFSAAAEIIAHLPLHQPAMAEAQLGQLLADILTKPPATDQLFSLLEYARPSLHFVRATAVRHYHEQAPHLEADAEAHFQRGLQLWQHVVNAYERCVEHASDNDAHTATLLHRCTMYIGMQILEHYRAKRQVPNPLWQQLHLSYAHAETRGLARQRIADEVQDESHTPHIQALYIAHLLTEVAQPYSRNPSDLNLIWQWADRWGHFVRLGRPRIAANKIAFVVDLAGDRPLHPEPGGDLADSIRGLNTSGLLQAMHEHLNDIVSADAMERLHLSSEGVARQQRLLQQLLPTWSLGTLPRRFKRTLADEGIALTTTFHGIYDVLAGTPGDAKEHEVATEHWRVIDHTPSGFRLTRDAEGIRIENGQLVALCPHDGGDYLLAQVQWLMREQSGQLLAGFAVLPGIPRAAAILGEEQFRGQAVRTLRAFLLPAAPAMHSEATIVLPLGFYHSGKVIALGKDKLSLGELVQRGADFERVTYQRI